MDGYIQKVKIYFSLIAIFALMAIGFGIVQIKDFVRQAPLALAQAVEAYVYDAEYAFFSDQEADMRMREFVQLASIDIGTAERAQSIPVLMYHGIVRSAEVGSGDISVSSFKEQLFTLKRAGYSTITLKELESYMRGTSSLPDKSIMITFDDGRADSYRYADPILRILDYSAVMFAITEYSLADANERIDYYLGPYDLRKMDKSDQWDVQAHAHSGHSQVVINDDGDRGNFYSHLAWIEDAQRIETPKEFEERIAGDMRTAKYMLEDLLQKDVRAFAFPFGDFGQTKTEFLEAQGYLLEHGSELFPLLFYQFAPGDRFTANYDHESSRIHASHMIKRIDVSGEWSGSELLRTVYRSRTKILPYTDGLELNQGWIYAWGQSHAVENGRLLVRSNSPLAGGAVILDGSRLWKDYVVHADVVTQSGDAAYMWARFQDDFNNAACSISDGAAHIEQTIDEERTILARSDLLRQPSQFTLSMYVDGNTMSCAIDGREVVRAENISSVLDSGGIGFKTWSSPSGPGILEVQKILVSPITSDVEAEVATQAHAN